MQDILIHIEEGILTISFHRPARKNSITGQMYCTMADALNSAAVNSDIRVAVIQGAPEVFTAGNDIGDFLENPATGVDAPPFRFLFALARFPKPVIAAVCGPAVGIGTTLLLHCDMVYAGDNALFAMPFVNLGLCPEAAASLLAPQNFGYQRAAEMLLLGESFNAEYALDIGLVNKILPPMEANAFVQTIAQKLAVKPIASLIATKSLMKSVASDQVEAVMRAEGDIFGEMLKAPAAREAFSAFMEKRKPDFKNL